MKLIIIAALNSLRLIGSNGKVPWDLPQDMKRFKQLTFGHSVLMGRKTYETLREPLVGRRNIILSKNKIVNVETFSSIESALRELRNEEIVWCIGGGNVFSQLLTSADEWKLTHVKNTIAGDTYFPPYEHLIGAKYKIIYEEEHSDFVFRDYVKLSS